MGSVPVVRICRWKYWTWGWSVSCETITLIVFWLSVLVRVRALFEKSSWGSKCLTDLQCRWENFSVSLLSSKKQGEQEYSESNLLSCCLFEKACLDSAELSYLTLPHSPKHAMRTIVRLCLYSTSTVTILGIIMVVVIIFLLSLFCKCSEFFSDLIKVTHQINVKEFRPRIFFSIQLKTLKSYRNKGKFRGLKIEKSEG